MATITKIINGHSYEFEVTREYEIAQKLLEFSTERVKYSFKRVGVFQVDLFAQYFSAYNKNNPFAKPYGCNRPVQKFASLYYNWSGNVVTYRCEIPDGEKLHVCPALVHLLADHDIVIVKVVRSKKFYDFYRISAGRLKWLLRECDSTKLSVEIEKKYFKHVAYQAPAKLKSGGRKYGAN